MRLLHSQSAAVNLSAGATVLSHPVTTATAYGLVALRISGLAAAAETTLTVAITIDGEPVGGSDLTETVQVGRTTLRKPIDGIEVAAGETLAIVITSDQAADTAVTVTASLRDASPLQSTTRGRQLLVDAEGDTTAGTTGEIAAAVPAPLTTADIVAALSSEGPYPIVWPLTDTESDTRELDRRDDYTDADPILIDVATVHDLAAVGVTFSFEAKRGGSTILGTGTLDSTLGVDSYRIAVLITSSQTDKTESTYEWKLVAILVSGTRHTVRRGCVKLV